MGIKNSTKSFSAPVPPNEGQLRDATGLEFPDWSGTAAHKARMTLEEAVRWNEEMLAMFPPKPNRAALDADARCKIQFLL